MALSRKQLAAMGIEAEKIDQIIEAHAETVSALKDEAEKYKENALKYADVQKELDQLKKSTEGKDYDKLKAEYEKYKADVEAEHTKAAKEKAYRDALKDANLSEKGVEKALKYAEWDKIELDDDGKLKDAKAHVKAVREEWAEYIVKQGTKGAETSTPPAGGGGGGSLTRADIYKTDANGRFVMDASERQKALQKIIAEEQQKG
jgi:hypothetical protein